MSITVAVNATASPRSEFSIKLEVNHQTSALSITEPRPRSTFFATSTGSEVRFTETATARSAARCPTPMLRRNRYALRPSTSIAASGTLCQPGSVGGAPQQIEWHHPAVTVQQADRLLAEPMRSFGRTAA